MTGKGAAHSFELLFGQGLLSEAPVCGSGTLPDLQQRPQCLQGVLGQLRSKWLPCHILTGRFFRIALVTHSAELLKELYQLKTYSMDLITPAKARGAGAGSEKLAEYTMLSPPALTSFWPFSKAIFQPYSATGSVWKRPRSTTVVVMIAWTITGVCEKCKSCMAYTATPRKFAFVLRVHEEWHSATHI